MSRLVRALTGGLLLPLLASASVQAAPTPTPTPTLASAPTPYPSPNPDGPSSPAQVGVLGISPNHGPASGGYDVNIRVGWDTNGGITFGGKPATVVSYVFHPVLGAGANGWVDYVVTVPAGKAGTTVPVKINNDYLTSTFTYDAATPTPAPTPTPTPSPVPTGPASPAELGVVSVSPGHGTAAGGNQVIITTRWPQGGDVKFGDKKAVFLSEVHETSVSYVAQAPAGTPGTTVPITIGGKGVSSLASSPTANDYSYDAGTPAIFDISPSYVPAGQTAKVAISVHGTLSQSATTNLGPATVTYADVECPDFVGSTCIPGATTILTANWGPVAILSPSFQVAVTVTDGSSVYVGAHGPAIFTSEPHADPTPTPKPSPPVTPTPSVTATPTPTETPSLDPRRGITNVTPGSGPAGGGTTVVIETQYSALRGPNPVIGEVKFGDNVAQTISVTDGRDEDLGSAVFTKLITVTSSPGIANTRVPVTVGGVGAAPLPIGSSNGASSSFLYTGATPTPSPTVTPTPTPTATPAPSKAPVISGIAGGGTPVVGGLVLVRGSKLTPLTALRVGSAKAIVLVKSSTLLFAYVPTLAKGSYAVSVVSPNGTTTAATKYTVK